MLISCDVISKSEVNFGTSGARGLVSQFTPEVCAAFTHGFLFSLKDSFQFSQIAIGIDNRPSSLAIAQACASALLQANIEPIYYGILPTPALAYQAMQSNIPAIMVTGSHIPFDRNGLKFYRPDGEITKQNEQDILTAKVAFDKLIALPVLVRNTEASSHYIQRYTSLFNKTFLAGKRIGIYEHSSAGRDLYKPLFQALGAEVISLERTNEFVPIDTEAVAESDKIKAKSWSDQYQLDCIFSTDGDGDRPLVADEKGEWLRGDILGLLTASALNIEAVAIPVSCNSAIERSNLFSLVKQTKIGSPYVIAEFESLSSQYLYVAGFEANGGFLLGSDVDFKDKIIKALPTRDAVLPVLMVLFESIKLDLPLSKLVVELPQYFTDSDRIQNFSTEKSRQILEWAERDPCGFLSQLKLESLVFESVNLMDGCRFYFTNGEIIHFRSSGNAPELRCYAESTSSNQASNLVRNALKNIQLINIK